MLKDKTVLIDNLTSVLENFKHNKKEVKRIKDILIEQYKISPGDVQGWINYPSEELPKLEANDPKALCIFVEELFNITKDARINPHDYYTERQIKEAKTTYQPELDDKITLPYTFTNVTKIADNDFIMPVFASELKRLYPLIQYNPTTQRDPRVRRDKKNPGKIIEEPKINQKNVKEMKQLLKTNQLISSVITLNARLGTSDVGEELIYDSKEHTLTITEGTLIDILDGFHRLQAINQALSEDPSIDMTFKLNIVNFDENMAKTYFEQMNRGTPVAKSRLAELNQENFSNFIAKQIQNNSELRGKVSSSDFIPPTSDFLVSFITLSDAIDSTFKVENKLEAIEVSKYLTEFFNTLCMTKPEGFLGNVVEVRNKSLINANQMFYGYVILAKRFKDENIPLNRLESVLNQIDFNRENPMWMELGVLDANGNVRANVKNKIKNFFMNISLKEGVS